MNALIFCLIIFSQLAFNTSNTVLFIVLFIGIIVSYVLVLLVIMVLSKVRLTGVYLISYGYSLKDKILSFFRNNHIFFNINSYCKTNLNETYVFIYTYLLLYALGCLFLVSFLNGCLFIVLKGICFKDISLIIFSLSIVI